MEIKDVKQAEDYLFEISNDPDIVESIENTIATWDFYEFQRSLDGTELKKLVDLYTKKILGDDASKKNIEALHWVVFDRIHDTCLACVKQYFHTKDNNFFEKCMQLLSLDISAEQLGANKNYNITLSAAIVELSLLDAHRTPTEKTNCLCTTYDLLFAEIKTAMVSRISENAEKENEIPVIENKDVLPVLMVVIIKSKLLHVFSNLFYVETFFNLDSDRFVCDIYKSFVSAVNGIMEVKLGSLQPLTSNIIKSIDLEEYIKITSVADDEEKTNKTLVDEENERAINLIMKSTNEEL